MKRNIGCGNVEVEKLHHRHYDEFAAFKVTTKRKFVDHLRDPNFWPKNVVVDFYKTNRRPFRNRENNYRKSNRTYDSNDMATQNDEYNRQTYGYNDEY